MVLNRIVSAFSVIPTTKRLKGFAGEISPKKCVGHYRSAEPVFLNVYRAQE
jgi:hypothetical protein